MENVSNGIKRFINLKISNHNDNSEAHSTEMNKKVDKVSGKGLSTNDFTNSYKNELDNLSTIYATKTELIVSTNLILIILLL